MFDLSSLSISSWALFYSSSSVLALLESLWITAFRGKPGVSSCWWSWFCVLFRLEVELDVDDFCKENLYPTVISVLIDICNKNLFAFDGCMLTVGRYSWRGIMSGTLIMFHFKRKAWIPYLWQGILTTCPYIFIFSKTDATLPPTLYPWYSQKIYCSAIQIYLEYKNCFCVPGVW